MADIDTYRMYFYTLLTSQVELQIGIMCACAPALTGLWTHVTRNRKQKNSDEEGQAQKPEPKWDTSSHVMARKKRRARILGIPSALAAEFSFATRTVDEGEAVGVAKAGNRSGDSEVINEDRKSREIISEDKEKHSLHSADT